MGPSEAEQKLEVSARIRQLPAYQTLVTRRTRFGWVLTAIMLVVYFGYIGLIAVLYVALNMMWEGHRQIVARALQVDSYNAVMPGFADIKAEELAHSCGVEKAGAVRDSCLEQVPGAADAAAAAKPGGH